MVEKRSVSGKVVYYFNDSVNSDYYSLLAPKAISYGAGVIDLFFRQAKAESDKKPTPLVKLKNTFSYLSGVLISSFTNFFGAYEETVINYSKTLSNNNTSAGVGRVLSEFEQAGSAEEIFTPKPTQASQTDNPPSAKATAPTPPLQRAQAAVNPPKPVENPVVETPTTKAAAPEPAAPSAILPPPPEKVEQPAAQPAQTAPTFIFVAGDSLPPETTIASGPSQLTNLSSADFTFTANEANSTFEGNLDDADWQACGSPHNLNNLADGNHVFKVRAIDPLNNIDLTPAEHSWTVDTTAPQITILSGPPDTASSTTASFQFSSSESETAYQCRFDANAFETCSASTTAASLIEGNHSLEVKGTDPAGNIGSSTIKTWLVDLTAATSTMASLDASYEATGFTVAWSGEDADGSGATTTASGIENYDLQYKIDSGDWQDWLSATISTSTIFNLAVASGQTIFFHVRARDLSGNLSDWSGEAQTQINNYIADHLVISEFATRGSAGAYDEFVELYNPTGEDVDLISWKLQTKSAEGINWTNRTGLLGLPAGIIRAKGYYLITASDYSLSVVPDYRHSARWGLADDGGHIRIVNNLEEEIDKVGYGEAIDPEGSAFAIDLSSGQSLERKANTTSTSETMAAGGVHATLGNGYDSDNNSNDFILRTSPKPQNSSS
ncbi:MAG: lamin tail domain-containing protein, partial [bacterium]|nr:lamin tail domain-containing protein [bacterium]